MAPVGKKSRSRASSGEELGSVQIDLFSAPQVEKCPPPVVEVSETSVSVSSPPLAPPQPELPKIYSVTELAQGIRDELRTAFPEILIQGEICDFKGIHRSGHLYFALKDAQSQIRAVMWRMDVVKVPFEIKAGLEVIVTGRVDYYTGGGSLQVVATRMEPVGIGALQLKFEQLKEKLRLEGLFDPARKRAIAPVNWHVGIVTGRSTAALQDMLKILRTRFPLAQVYLFHASVQGEKAPAEIVQAIERANRFSQQSERALDVLIVGRGGGSYEDLFCFNDERVARALVASKIPTVSAVGHEIDVTIADMVADRRAATPSHAAQEVVPDRALWLERLRDLHGTFRTRVEDRVYDLRQRIDLLHSKILAASPQKRLELQMHQVQEKRLRLESAMERALEVRRQRLSRWAGVFEALSPLKVLERGYAWAEGPRGLLKSVKEVSSGDLLKLRLSDGIVRAQVLDSADLG